MEPLPWVLLAKPFLYWGVFETARTWSAGPRRIPWWQPPWASILRLIAGIVVGIPLAVIFASTREIPVIFAFSLFRLVLWLLFLLWMFPDFARTRRLLLALAATGLNWAVDLLAFGGLWTDFRALGG